MNFWHRLVSERNSYYYQNKPPKDSFVRNNVLCKKYQSNLNICVPK